MRMFIDVYRCLVSRKFPALLHLSSFAVVSIYIRLLRVNHVMSISQHVWTISGFSSAISGADQIGDGDSARNSESKVGAYAGYASGSTLWIFGYGSIPIDTFLVG